jgi:hypothetical protein
MIFELICEDGKSCPYFYLYEHLYDFVPLFHKYLCDHPLRHNLQYSQFRGFPIYLSGDIFEVKFFGSSSSVVLILRGGDPTVSKLITVSLLLSKNIFPSASLVSSFSLILLAQ